MKWAYRVLAGCLGVLVAFLLVLGAEYFSFLALKWRGKTQESFGRRYHVDPSIKYVPFVGFRYRPNRKNVRGELGTDRHGFIHNGDPNRDLRKKRSRTVRIFMLGGSSVAGTFSSPQTTLAGFLERKLNRQFSGKNLQFEVINTGTSSWISSQELALRTYYLPDLGLDIAITLDGFNDVYHAIRAPEAGWEPNIHARMSQIAAGAETFTYSIRGNFFQILGQLRLRTYTPDTFHNFVAMVRHRVLRTSAPPAKREIDVTPDAMHHYRRNLAMMMGIARATGTKHFAILQPTVLLSNVNGSTDRQMIVDRVEKSYGPGYWKTKERLYQEARAIFRGLAGEFGDGRAIVVRDYSRLLDEPKERYYYDQIHYFDVAHDLITDEMVKDLKSTLLQDELRNPDRP